ncbi:acyl-CoA dehydrogenase [Ponticaulis sp.]|uniref:acyl-CoA dehydrogenase n=1 Tax=Ponticaulis sp. TaxID=2020902 RepID=UPI000B665CDF|nr:acyl-CoA dehydrogenase [Ponticaulis sp.]MAI91585.1 acyl-CoA dehydrogenase [Ponticaulis sp.]OUX97539.1 MAG: acyl-CoA dehydrogenase [Hyphomonadaceae bacterium TMED5]|tara:strand:+ start:47183 stop:48946 length:1764 start_codon:yes stop_codon:yes gene_type:complete
MITSATIDDVTKVLTDVTGIGALSGQDTFPEFDEDLVGPVLEEAGKLAKDILAPLNQSGDREGAVLRDGQVYSAAGFKDAYAAFRDGGWMGLAFPEEYGGQGLPKTLAVAVMELVQAANMSFSLCPMLTFGAIEALIAHGTEEQKASYLPKLVSGEWTGTMNLTEPQAGSDVGALKTKAEPNGDGSYAITGQKIFITWGDHDLTDNIVHLVLARLPDAPSGSKGISLFLCPKFLLDENGEPGERNSVGCIGLEHKLGIMASPTCVMEYDGAKGWLIGEPNKGLAAMFTMMNSARLQVGVQGVAMSEAAYSTARQYAEERKQGRAAGVDGSSPIINHPDIQNMLLQMRARTMAARSICFECAQATDIAETASETADAKAAKQLEEILTPIAKSWSTDIGMLSASIGVQIHGGMGFMGETLASQLYRDARIAPVYEGTNGIQAIDLATRKLSMADGGAILGLLDQFAENAAAMASGDDRLLKLTGDRLSKAVTALRAATEWLLDVRKGNADALLFGATAYQELFGRVAGVHYLARGAMSANGKGSNSGKELASLALFLADFDLGDAEGFLARIKLGEALSPEDRMELLP